MSTTLEPPVETPAAEPAQAKPSPGPRRPTKKLLAIAAAVLLIVGAALFLTHTLSGNTATGAVKGGSADAQYQIGLPKGWRALTKAELAKVPSHPLGILRRNDGTGFLVIRRAGKLPSDLNAFSASLDKQFKSRFKDFKRQTAKVIKTRSGKAFFYSYLNKKKGTVTSVTIVPAKKGSFTLNSVSKGGEDAVARELGRMIVSFKD